MVMRFNSEQFLAEGSNPLYNYYYSECIGLETISDGFFGLALERRFQKTGLSDDIPQPRICHCHIGYVTNGIQ